jgi:hypothetical protein
MSFVFFFIRDEYQEKYINHIGFTGDTIYSGDLSLLNSSDTRIGDMIRYPLSRLSILSFFIMVGVLLNIPCPVVSFRVVLNCVYSTFYC